MVLCTWLGLIRRHSLSLFYVCCLFIYLWIFVAKFCLHFVQVREGRAGLSSLPKSVFVTITNARFRNKSLTHAEKNLLYFVFKPVLLILIGCFAQANSCFQQKQKNLNMSRLKHVSLLSFEYCTKIQRSTFSGTNVLWLCYIWDE